MGVHRPTAALIALAMLGVAGLGVAASKPPPTIFPDQASNFVGQEVVIVGRVLEPRPGGGATWFMVARDGAAIQARFAESINEGWAQVQGRIGWHNGAPLMFATSVAPAILPGVPEVSLVQLASEPEAWEHRSVVVHATVERDVLRHDWYTVARGEGPWQEGPARVSGMLLADDRCACYKFHADHVLPWTS